MSGTDGLGEMGKRNTMLMKTIHRTAMAPTGTLHFPRLNGPGVKSLVPRNLAAMGMAYAASYVSVHPTAFLQLGATVNADIPMYSATMDMEKMALMAESPANANNPRIMDHIATNQTVFTGVLV